MNRFPVTRDILERVFMTFAQAMLALATADGVGWTDWTSWNNWKTWAISAVAAAFALLKSLIATKVGRNKPGGPSGSLDPAVRLAPTLPDQRRAPAGDGL